MLRLPNILVLACQLLCLTCIQLVAQPEGDAEEIVTPPGWITPFTEDLRLHIRIENSRLHASFINPEGEAVAVPGVARFSARVTQRGGVPKMLVLNPNEPGTLYTHPEFYRRPWVFNITLSLLDADGEALRSHSFFMSQLDTVESAGD